MRNFRNMIGLSVAALALVTVPAMATTAAKPATAKTAAVKAVAKPAAVKTVAAKPVTAKSTVAKPAAAKTVTAKPAALPRAAAAPRATAAVARPATRTFAPRAVAPQGGGRMVNARLSNGQTVTYNCSLAGNQTKQACKR